MVHSYRILSIGTWPGPPSSLLLRYYISQDDLEQETAKDIGQMRLGQEIEQQMEANQPYCNCRPIIGDK